MPAETTPVPDVPLGPHGTYAGPADAHLTWELFAVAVILALALAGFRFLARETGSAREREDDKSIPGIRAASDVLLVVGIVGLVGHSVFVSLAVGESWIPTLDLTSLAWIALLIIAFLLPSLKGFTAFGVSVTLAELKRDAVKVTFDATELLKNWQRTTSNILRQKELYDDSDEHREVWKKLVTRFVAERGHEALDWIGTKDEVRRFSVWLIERDPEPPDLVGLFYSSEELPEHRMRPFRVGEGLVGIVAEDQQSINTDDGASYPGYVRRGNDPEDFKGIYVTPITREVEGGDRALGVLVFDRKNAERFPPQAQNVIEALAANLALVLDPQT
ncbi:MAG: GAF domain-containing protein [Vulcanimicrobiaceae bacterium]